ncbi:MAG: 3-dehydroquinate synthase [SAR202 cluster bacterium]|nr:3-dehydroquinate synthase [SAR202 cluster bacterium]
MSSGATCIILTGFSGSGKTAVGRRVARLLGWEFADTDEIVARRAGKEIDRIFADDGEQAFRALELEAVREASSRKGIVVSTGGGAIAQEATRRVMLDAGLVVCLEARPETIYARLTAPAPADGAEAMVRPLLRATHGQDPLRRIESLKRERQWAYALAEWTVPTDGLSVEQVAHEVARAWRRFGMSSQWRGDSQVAATVTTDAGAYPIVVGFDIIEAQLASRLLQTGFAGRAYLLVDSNVLHPYGRSAQRSLHAAGIETHLFVFPAGEESKSLATATAVYEWLAERRVERRDLIVTVGGGVAGDLGGFVAATYVRGVRYAQVPTTLTAMVDSSIGGKTAVDLPAGKNLVGAFHHPTLVVSDVSALRTLPRRVVLEGWAEAIKHGFALDAGLVDVYEQQADALLALEPELTAEVVARNAAVKARIVTQDERETSGLRSLLNYGHTIGHGLETAAGYGRYLHGEAVAVGMVGAARLGELAGVTPAELARRQRALLERFGLPTGYRDVDAERILDAVTRDKKSSGGQVSWVFLDAVGRSSIHRGVTQEQVRQVLGELAG